MGNGCGSHSSTYRAVTRPPDSLVKLDISADVDESEYFVQTHSIMAKLKRDETVPKTGENLHCVPILQSINFSYSDQVYRAAYTRKHRDIKYSKRGYIHGAIMAPRLMTGGV